MPAVKDSMIQLTLFPYVLPSAQQIFIFQEEMQLPFERNNCISNNACMVSFILQFVSGPIIFVAFIPNWTITEFIMNGQPQILWSAVK